MKTNDELLEELKQAKQKIEEVEKQLQERNTVEQKEQPLWKQMGLPREPKVGEIMEVWDEDKKPEQPVVRRFFNVFKTGLGKIRVSAFDDKNSITGIWRHCSFVEQPSTPKHGIWVARDKDGKLFLYDCKPCRDKDTWCTDGEYMLPYSNVFPDLKWEDEPLEI